MEEIEIMVNTITDKTFEILKNIYSYRVEGQPTDSKDLGSRILFPHYSTKHRDGEIRFSEQELRFVFVEQFNRYCEENNLHYYYSVETPTQHKYLFSNKKDPHLDEGGQSAMVDLAIHDSNLNRVALIEFKSSNPEKFCYEKDFCKLKEEQSEYENICTFFIMFVKSADGKTIKSIHHKIQEKKGNTIFRCYNLEIGKDISEDIIKYYSEQ